jgi:hypothetical protein
LSEKPFNQLIEINSFKVNRSVIWVKIKKHTIEIKNFKQFMTELNSNVDQAYEWARSGNWAHVLETWKLDSQLSRACSRYREPSSGWTFLHLAARDGHEAASRELIRLGANGMLRTREMQSAADIAQQHQHHDLSNFLYRAAGSLGSLWHPSHDPGLLPSSNLWEEAQERRATESMRVAYGGGIVSIPAGSRYYVDSFERTLIGWHGSYDPPCGMDDMPMTE